MKHGARIAATVVIVALYAPLLFLFLLEVLPYSDIRAIGEVVRGDPCTSDCSPRHLVGVIALTLPAVLTLPALIFVGVMWIRRGRRGDRELKAIDGWLKTDPPVIQPDPPPEPEPQRFYRDRQGRLRPLKSAVEDEFTAD